jgi:putative flavoprotein involved in K+ transport
MTTQEFETIIVGGGQAGIALSAQLKKRGLPHVIFERNRIAERWRSERWDSLVANGPAWHDRFPDLTFDMDGDAFAPRDSIVRYFETFAEQIAAPVRCGVAVTEVRPADGGGFTVQTSDGLFRARNVVAATGPFQKPIVPTLVPAETGIVQMHSAAYRNPAQLPDGAVLVVGAGSSGAQIADELCRAGKRVFLSVGPHDRPPRRYRGQDFVWWLGKLGKWDARAQTPGTEHVTIAVSGARGGHTVDFRELAAQGMILLGRAGAYADGRITIGDDLAANIARGDANYLSVLDEADAFARANGIDLPDDPDARKIGPMPDCVTNPIQSLDLKAEGITSIIWATGYALDFGWLKCGQYDAQGRPAHEQGVSDVPGLYFLGLPWLTRRASPFIWGVWHDADHVAGVIAARKTGAVVTAAE